MPRKDILLALRVAATYIGTIVGAGFASGQELLQFFSLFGGKGLLGIVLAGIAFSLLGVKVLTISHRIGSASYHDLLLAVSGKRFGLVLDLMVTVFLLGGLCVMIAGTGALGRDYLQLSYNAGLLITAALTVFTVLHGIKGIMLANSIVVPLLTVAAACVSILSLTHHGLDLTILDAPQLNPTIAPHWAVSALLYVSYNLILSLTVLSSLGTEVPSRRALILGGWLGGSVLGILASLLVIVILLHLPEAAKYDIPLLHITNSHGRILSLLYVLVLWAEMFTTAISNLYGFAKFTSDRTGLSYSCVVVSSTLLIIFFSQKGFVALMTLLYPLFGYASLGFLLSLMLKR